MKTKNSIKKWLCKTFLAILGLTAIVNPAQSQNNIWSMPPNYFNNGLQTITALPQGLDPNIDYAGQPASNAHNSMQDSNGNLLFFIVDDRIFDKDGYLIDYLYYNNVSVKGTSEISIIPDPANCQKYYIISAGRFNYAVGFSPKLPYFAILDMSRINLYHPGRLGGLEYFNYGTTSSIASITPNFPANPKQGGCYFAASKVRSDNSRLVFISDGNGIFRYKIDNTGFHYDNYYLSYGPSHFNQTFSRGEMELVELSNGNFRIAAPYIYESFLDGKQAIFTAELNSSGTLIPNTNNSLYFEYTPTDVFRPFIHGLEFSPDGSLLYITHDNSTQHPDPFEYYDFSPSGTGLVQSLNVVNALDFKSSQIELGLDGKLYLATSDRLATLSNPNTPNIQNWTNSAKLITYLANYEGVSTPDYSLKSYMLPDQIDGMDYESQFQTSIQCCMLNTSFDADIYTATSTETWQPGATSNPFGSVSGDVLIKKELIIPAGKSILIKNMTFKFAPGARVVVERGTGIAPGGKLTMDKTTFTVYSKCDSKAMWLGVQVYGHPNQTQLLLNSQQGWLKMMNGSRIEHAIKGIVAAKINSSTVYPYNFTTYDFNYTGGIINADNSYFLNNRQDIELRRYVSININNFNRSGFVNCDFITDGLLNNPLYSPLYHVLIEDVGEVRFVGNRFKNLNPSAYDPNKRGWGIYSVDATYKLNARCISSIYDLGCSSYDPNEFNGLYFGIVAYSNKPLNTIQLDRSKFINNYYGVYLGGLQFAKLTLNEFNVLPHATTPTYGLYLDRCTSYKVEENSFSEYFDTNIGLTYGVVVNNSGVLANEIYKNQFGAVKYGLQAQGLNGSDAAYGEQYPTNKGLKIRCNTFAPDIDQAAMVLASGKIAFYQGICLSPSNPLAAAMPAGNTFSHTSVDIAVNNSAYDFSYNHHMDLFTEPLTFYNANKVLLGTCNQVWYDNVSSCPSKIINGAIDSQWSGLKLQTDSLRDLIAHQERLIDAGNTNILLNSIGNQNDRTLEATLLEVSPYLSDQVISAYLATNPEPENLKRIILQNSPVSQKVLDLLSGIKLPTKIKNQIDDAQYGVSPMTYLKNEIALLTEQRGYLVDEQIRMLLGDPLIPNSSEIVAEILREEGREIFSKELDNNFFGRDNSLDIFQKEDAVTDETGSVYYVKVTNDQSDEKGSSPSYYGLTTDASVSNTDLDKDKTFFARIDILQPQNKTEYGEETLTQGLEERAIHQSLGDNNAESVNSHLVNNSSDNLVIHPNPVADSFTISLIGNGLKSVEILSITGQIILSKNYTEGNAEEVLDISQLASGIYLVKAYDIDNEQFTKKLVKE